MNSSARAPLSLLLAAVAVFVVGVALAVAQPGDLGDDDEAAAPQITSAQTGGTAGTSGDTTGTSATPGDTTDTSTDAGTGAGGAGDGGSDTGGGSGGLDGSGADTPDRTTAATGAESMLPLALVLVGAALALRRLRTPRAG